jgi:hypothetical protein
MRYENGKSPFVCCYRVEQNYRDNVSQNPPPDFMKHGKDGSLLLVCFLLAACDKISIPTHNPTILKS